MTTEDLSRPGPLADRDVRRFLGGRLISEIGSRITREGLPVTAILALSASAPQLALLTAVSMLPGLLLSPFAGVLADRHRRRPILIWGDIVRALSLLLIPLLYALHRLQLWQVVFVSFVVTGVSVAYQIADQAYFPFLVGRDRLAQGNALLYTAGAVGETAGPTLMGALVQLFGAPLAILFDAISYLVSALAILSIRRREPLPARATAEPTAASDSLRGMRVVLRHPILRALLAVTALSSFFGGFFATLYELYVLRTLHLSPLALGVLVTAGGVGSLFGAPYAARLSRRLGAGRTVAWSFLAGTLLEFFVPLARGGWFFAFSALFLAQILGDLVGTVYEVNEVVLRQGITPDDWLGRVSGSIQFAVGGLGVLGALVSGILALHLGARSAFWVAALGQLLAALWLLSSPVARVRGDLSIAPGAFPGIDGA